MTFFNRWGVENLQHAKLSWRRPRMSMHVWWAPASYKWTLQPLLTTGAPGPLHRRNTSAHIKTSNIKDQGFSKFRLPWSKSKSFVGFVAVIQKNCSLENERLEPHLEKENHHPNLLFFDFNMIVFRGGLYNVASLSLLLCFGGLFFFVFFSPGFFGRWKLIKWPKQAAAAPKRSSLEKPSQRRGKIKGWRPRGRESMNTTNERKIMGLITLKSKTPTEWSFEFDGIMKPFF